MKDAGIRNLIDRPPLSGKKHSDGCEFDLLRQGILRDCLRRFEQAQQKLGYLARKKGRNRIANLNVLLRSGPEEEIVVREGL